MTCPACSTAMPETFTEIAGVTVCQTCARSLVLLEHDDCRLATAEDIRELSPAQVTQLRKSRPANWRQAQLATKARLRGR